MILVTTEVRCNLLRRQLLLCQRAIADFPAHCHSPGLITITDDTLLFTPLSSSRPTVTIDLKSVVGVKRTSGVTKGLKVRWAEGPDDEEKEAKFSWVGGQSELFARLVGWQGRRWMAI